MKIAFNNFIRFPQTQSSDMLNLGTIDRESIVVGPGIRFAIWVQGCTLHCTRCFNQWLWPHRRTHVISIYELGDQILENTKIEGVSFSGGEPFEQALPLARLCTYLKERRPQLTYLCYTGYTLSALQQRKDPEINSFLKELDILIDGPYIENLKGNYQWRGSKNQNIYFLTSRSIPHRETKNDTIVTQIQVFGDNHVRISGINIDSALVRHLHNALKGDG